VAPECLGVGGPVAGIDRHHRRGQLRQSGEDGGLVADGLLQHLDRDLGRGGRHVGGHPLDQDGRGWTGHPPDEGRGRGDEVLPERGYELLELRPGRWISEGVVGVGPDNPQHLVAQPKGGLDDHVTAHRVTDQHDLAEPQVPYHRGDVVAEGRHGPPLTAAA